MYQKKKRKEVVHQRRPRRERYGELVQLDGSHHHWFEDRAAPCVLLAAIDDATSNIVAARFEIGETTNGYFRLVEQHFNKHGLPAAYYSDKFGVFRVNQGNDRSKKTQFKVAMDTVKVQTICADSPQAKGRIERLFGTLQDRLVKEMRLRGISTIKEANVFLGSYTEEHNKQFGRSPKNPSDAHRSLNHDLDLRRILCKKDSRKVSKNLEISWFNRVLQIQPNGRVNRLRGVHVEVLETPDGELLLEYRGKQLEFVEFVEGVAQPAVVGTKDLATLKTG